MSERVLLFTKWPEAGRAKTRLVPALGESGAADLHRALAQRTVEALRILRRGRGSAIRVVHTGAAASAMRDWLGADLQFRPQVDGDLGARLRAAFEDAFADGCKRVLAVGSDCPGLAPPLLSQAFDALKTTDLVLGPARDGGYTLIGMNALHRDFFDQVPWSTASVLAITRARANEAGLRTALLPPLTDIDTPDDLPMWEAVRTEPPAWTPGRISVVVPVLNEEARIADCIASIAPDSEVEAIVVDGGSSDGTVEAANGAGATVLPSAPGRGMQMNAGASLATGETFLFLHGDTRLPRGWRQQVGDLLAGTRVSLGAFRLGIDAPDRGLRWVETLANLRSRWLGFPYGDQAFFLRRDVFEALGGFAGWPLLEDLDFARRAAQRGRVALAPGRVLTAPDRWKRLGLVRTTLVNQFILLAFAAGVGPGRLARWYRRAMPAPASGRAEAATAGE